MGRSWRRNLFHTDGHENDGQFTDVTSTAVYNTWRINVILGTKDMICAVHVGSVGAGAGLLKHSNKGPRGLALAHSAAQKSLLLLLSWLSIVLHQPHPTSLSLNNTSIALPFSPFSPLPLVHYLRTHCPLPITITITITTTIATFNLTPPPCDHSET